MESLGADWKEKIPHCEWVEQQVSSNFLNGGKGEFHDDDNDDNDKNNNDENIDAEENILYVDN